MFFSQSTLSKHLTREPRFVLRNKSDVVEKNGTEKLTKRTPWNPVDFPLDFKISSLKTAQITCFKFKTTSQKKITEQMLRQL